MTPRHSAATLGLAEAVSWRSIHGPLSSVRLSAIGPGSRTSASLLGMEIVDGVAYLTRRTPDLAERMLSEDEAKRAKHPRPSACPANTMKDSL